MPHLFQEDFVEECSYLNRGPALTAAEYGHPELHPAWRAAVPALMARLCCRLGTGSRAGLCAAARVVPRGTRARGALRFSHWPERRLCVSAVLIALGRRTGPELLCALGPLFVKGCSPPALQPKTLPACVHY